jgi:hypothetical protein
MTAALNFRIRRLSPFSRLGRRFAAFKIRHYLAPIV